MNKTLLITGAILMLSSSIAFAQTTDSAKVQKVNYYRKALSVSKDIPPCWCARVARSVVDKTKPGRPEPGASMTGQPAGKGYS